ncbi:DUF4249 domain-containing protein [Salinimicrobium terrae]|uniref:DUF4249 domain-containing protein n=1 Tax=Salinimicrobium terrae TaxID=470866 RepID=UPI0003F863E8|nr:DUF4249 domain-containing protein [Salinimicrobium terrae]
MKKIFLIFIIVFISCEEVVDVELKESEPRLVIEASLLWDEEREENLQFIKLSSTAPYFNEEISPATGASVKIITETGEEYLFREVSDGLYQNDEIVAVQDIDYHLEIVYQNELYTATEQFVLTPTLQFVEQELGGFSDDEYEFKVYYEDPAERANFYLFRYLNERYYLQIYNDEFTNGNQTFAFFSDEDATPGDLVIFEVQGISQQFYEYMFILRSQAGNANGGPFQTQPSIVRGNIVNQTNPDNFPFGYFRLSEVDVLAYEVE